jgi:Co/Zn/Cd efflux system component
MSSSCCDREPVASNEGSAYRRVLWTALGINVAMFAIEIVAALIGKSVSLQADAIDFLGDAGNYGISLLVLGLGLSWRARAAMLKGATMGLFGLWVLGTTAYHVVAGSFPSAPIMGAVGFLALAANVTCAAMLYKFRAGDANMRSVWLCSRNDAIGNIAVMAAAGGVWATGTLWPDVIVGIGIATLAISAGIQVLRRARAELAQPAAA